MLKTSQPFAQIAEAFAKAQAAMTHPTKDKTAKVSSTKGNYEYDYADLASVLDVVRPALNQHGISLLQSPEVRGDQLTVTTTLLHTSGEWIASELSSGVDPHERITTIGSAITYLRRYSVMALVGIATASEDDDGQSAKPPPQQQARSNGQGNGRAPATAGAPAGSQAASPAQPKPTAAASGTATTTAPATTATADPTKAECSDLVVKLAGFAGQDFGREVWEGHPAGERRLNALRKATTACAEIMRVLGDERGAETIHGVVRNGAPLGSRMATLHSASLGEVPADSAEPPF